MGNLFQNFGMTSPVEGRVFITSIVLATLYSFIFSCVRIYFMNDKEMKSKKKRVEFLTTMLILSPTISLIMTLIGQDIATAFALLGLMSIIKLQNPSTGVGDIIYFLVAITIGMTCGEHYFLIGGVFSIFISALLLLTRVYGHFFLTMNDKEGSINKLDIEEKVEKKPKNKVKKNKDKERIQQESNLTEESKIDS